MSSRLRNTSTDLCKDAFGISNESFPACRLFIWLALHFNRLFPYLNIWQQIQEEKVGLTNRNKYRKRSINCFSATGKVLTRLLSKLTWVAEIRLSQILYMAAVMYGVQFQVRGSGLEQFCTNLAQRQSKSYKTSFGWTETKAMPESCESSKSLGLVDASGEIRHGGRSPVPGCWLVDAG